MFALTARTMCRITLPPMITAVLLPLIELRRSMTGGGRLKSNSCGLRPNP
ncbi:hypothetical protein QDT91_29365 (plasmid) [Mycolicibacterium aubagnense]|nr:hypothetical protein [Mycolicibacterium aubagnense]WGI36129.1 hypothetical protein QDT91_29365 [Mycolicibacterium aubagnense]